MDEQLAKWTRIAGGLSYPIPDTVAQAEAVVEFRNLLGYACLLAAEVEKLKAMAWAIANYDPRGKTSRGD